MPKKIQENVCDKRMFSLIYKKYSQEVYNFLYYRYGESLNPADRMQDAFVKLLSNCKKVAPEKAKAFLLSVAKNMVLNEVKHQKVVWKHQNQKPKNYTHESPEFELEQKEFLEGYEKALGKLTEDQRVSFLLNKLEGKKHAEIAELLGVTRKAVENRIYKAYKILQNELEGFKLQK